MESQDSDSDEGASQFQRNAVVSFILSLKNYVHRHVLTMAQQNYYKIPYFRRE